MTPHESTDGLVFRPIGVIHSPFAEPCDMPIQPTGSDAAAGTVEIHPEFRAGLDGLEGFSHVHLIYVFHRSSGCELTVVPFLDDRPHGVFATRAPRRPNPIGLSVVGLERIVGGVLHVRGLDVVDGTPLLDIKPFVPGFDVPAGDVRIGWLEGVVDRAKSRRSDGRFT